MVSKILVPTDGSKQAERAGERAISLMNVTGGDIIVLFVIDTSYLNALPQHDLREQLNKEMKEEGKQAVGKFKKGWNKVNAMASVKTLIS